MWGLRFSLMLSVVKYLEGMPFNPMGGGFPHIDMFEVQVAPDRIVNVTVDRFREVADTNRSAYNKILDILNVTTTNYSYNPLLKGPGGGGGDCRGGQPEGQHQAQPQQQHEQRPVGDLGAHCPRYIYSYR